MKNLNLFIAVACLMVFASCQKPKDWTCTCDCKPTGGSSKTETTTIKNSKQSAANTACADYGKAKVGGNGTWNCKIN